MKCGVEPSIVRLFHGEFTAAHSRPRLDPPRFFHITHLSFYDEENLYSLHSKCVGD